MAAPRTKVNLIPAGLEAETADACACEWSQQDAPDPSGCAHFAAHAGHADVVALGASHLYGVVGVARVRWVFAVIFLLLGLIGGRRRRGKLLVGRRNGV